MLKGVEELLERHSNMERERSRIALNNLTMKIIFGVFVELSIVGVAAFVFGIQFAVEKARDQVHSMSGDKKTKEMMWNLFDTAYGWVGHKIASPVIFVGRAVGAGGRRVGAIGKSIGVKLGLVKVEGAVEVELPFQVEAMPFEGLLIWCP
ncbi:unnamed protein product [Urochloa humidicola]